MEGDRLCWDRSSRSSGVHGSTVAWRKDNPNLGAGLGFAWLARLGRWYYRPRFGAGLVSVLTSGEHEKGRQKEDPLYSTEHRSQDAAVERHICGAGETGFGSWV